MDLRDRVLFEPPELGCVLALTGLPGAGSKIHDRSAYNSIGAVTGAAWVRLPSGLWCLSFDGNDDCVNCGNGASLAISGDITFLVWICPNSVSEGYKVIATKHYAYEFDWGINDDEVKFHHGDGTFETGSSSGAGLKPGVWQHVAVVRTTTPKKVRFYVDGACISTWSYFKTVLAGASAVYVGTRFPGYVWNGLIGPLRVHNLALSALEIQNRFSQEKGLFGVW